MINGSEYKIIVLSENTQYRNVLASKLRIEGFSVEFASGGFHILAILERFQDINMIICHENMNDMSAEEIISMARLTRTKSVMPILYISKDNDEEAVCDIILNGANEFILQSSNMLPAIESVIKHHSKFKATQQN